MKIAILGTGMVGQTLALALAAKGHSITIGTRNVEATLATTEPNAYGVPAFGVWHKTNGHIGLANFAAAIDSAELLINATNGAVVLDILREVPEKSWQGKTMMDLANDLAFSNGAPPTVRISDTIGSSIGERIQNRFAGLNVVKTLNTMNVSVMVNPSLTASGAGTVFVAGNSKDAKAGVIDLLKAFGWDDILDLGSIESSRATELLLPIWLKLWPLMGATPFNFKIAR